MVDLSVLFSMPWFHWKQSRCQIDSEEFMLLSVSDMIHRIMVVQYALDKRNVTHPFCHSIASLSTISIFKCTICFSNLPEREVKRSYISSLPPTYNVKSSNSLQIFSSSGVTTAASMTEIFLTFFNKDNECARNPWLVSICFAPPPPPRIILVSSTL